MDYYGNDKVYVGTWPWSFDFDWWKYRNRPKIEESSLEYITQYSELHYRCKYQKKYLD